MTVEVTNGSDFAPVIQRLTEDKSQVAFIEYCNLRATRPSAVAVEMAHTAASSTRCRKPVYHLHAAFHPEDKVSASMQQKAARCYVQRLGLETYQALIVARHDGERAYVDAIFNRVHPRWGRAWPTGLDWRRLEEATRSLEQEWDLCRLPVRWSRVGRGTGIG